LNQRPARLQLPPRSFPISECEIWGPVVRNLKYESNHVLQTVITEAMWVRHNMQTMKSFRMCAGTLAPHPATTYWWFWLLSLDQLHESFPQSLRCKSTPRVNLLLYFNQSLQVFIAVSLEDRLGLRCRCIIDILLIWVVYIKTLGYWFNTAYHIIGHRNHGSIILSTRPPNGSQFRDLFLSALCVIPFTHQAQSFSPSFPLPSTQLSATLTGFKH